VGAFDLSRIDMVRRGPAVTWREKWSEAPLPPGYFRSPFLSRWVESGCRRSSISRQCSQLQASDRTCAGSCSQWTAVAAPDRGRSSSTAAERWSEAFADGAFRAVVVGTRPIAANATASNGPELMAKEVTPSGDLGVSVLVSVDDGSRAVWVLVDGESAGLTYDAVDTIDKSRPLARASPDRVAPWTRTEIPRTTWHLESVLDLVAGPLPPRRPGSRRGVFWQRWSTRRFVSNSGTHRFVPGNKTPCAEMLRRAESVGAVAWDAAVAAESGLRALSRQPSRRRSQTGCRGGYREGLHPGRWR